MDGFGEPSASATCVTGSLFKWSPPIFIMSSASVFLDRVQSAAGTPRICGRIGYFSANQITLSASIFLDHVQ